LPFRDQTFDVALATFTLHHWSKVAAGLNEMRRVAKRQVILLFGPSESLKFWLVEYFPECLELPSETGTPGVDDVRVHLNVHTVAPVPIPPDCTDGFAGAYWRRFEAYLEPAVRASISSLALLSPEDGDRGRGGCGKTWCLVPGMPATDICESCLRLTWGIGWWWLGAKIPLTPFMKRGDYGSIRRLSWTLHFPRNNLNCSSGCGG